MLVTLLPIVMLVREVQLLNAELLMLVTLSGIVKLVAVLPMAYCSKVLPSLVYKFPSIDWYAVLPVSAVMLVSEVQYANAESPMLVTLAGISMLVREVQYANAKEPMLVTLSGITMLFNVVFFIFIFVDFMK